jgi:serine/threonine protein kinase
MMELICDEGRTSTVYRVIPGLIVKSPRTSDYLSAESLAEFKNAFAVEEKLLERLGRHPRIVRYVPTSTNEVTLTVDDRYYELFTPANEDKKHGLLLHEANRGNLQSFIDNQEEIDDFLRRKWSVQIAEAVAYVHKKGIIHSNISTTNVLLHQEDNSIDLLLADFGGSRCSDLDLDGGLAPDDPFFDPHSDVNTEKIDVFSLGVLLYVINTSQYPFHEGPAPQGEERFEYGHRVLKLYKEGKFPDLRGVQFEEVIAGCCVKRHFETAEGVFLALKAELPQYDLK